MIYKITEEVSERVAIVQVTVPSVLTNRFKLLSLFFTETKIMLKVVTDEKVFTVHEKTFYNFSTCVEFGKDWAMDDAQTKRAQAFKKLLPIAILLYCILSDYYFLRYIYIWVYIKRKFESEQSANEQVCEHQLALSIHSISVCHLASITVAATLVLDLGCALDVSYFAGKTFKHT